ncbi:hypothetical protein DTO164E3_6305 [Paecilomyces variotii]|nr:hypothetical protein DTO164E3_6305 [Paecilomyces variotii]
MPHIPLKKVPSMYGHYLAVAPEGSRVLPDQRGAESNITPNYSTNEDRLTLAKTLYRQYLARLNDNLIQFQREYATWQRERRAWEWDILQQNLQRPQTAWPDQTPEAERSTLFWKSPPASPIIPTQTSFCAAGDSGSFVLDNMGQI